MMHSFAILFALVASVSAYSVTVPNESQGWTNDGQQTLTWQRVDSDPVNFTAVLTNQDTSLYPGGPYSQVLAALVDGTQGTTKLNAPSGGWPLGGHFRVNLVKDATDLNSILAQSSEFNINTSTTTTGTNKPSTLPSTSSPTGTTLVAPPNSQTTTDLNPTTTGAFTGSSNGALHTMGVPMCLLGAITFLSFVLG